MHTGTTVTGTHSTINEYLRLRGQQPTTSGVTIETRDGPAVSMTYTQLAHAATRLASSLVANGLKPQDQVAILLPTSMEFCLSFFDYSLSIIRNKSSLLL